MDIAPVPPPPHPTYDLYESIDAALAEDAGDLGDLSTLATIKEDRQAKATFVSKADGVIAGIWVAQAVLFRVDPSLSVEWKVLDGQSIVSGDVIGSIEGTARSILVAERVALNFMQRMSGIATFTQKMARAAERGGARLLDTRKTVPGLRLLDKWSVLIGGGLNHRIGLFDMLMIKDNHIAAAGGIAEAIAAAESYLTEHGMKKPIEVETRTLREVQAVLDILDSEDGHSQVVTRVMLDNMTSSVHPGGGIDVQMLKAAVDMIGGRDIETEASGNVTLANIEEIARTGVQYISCGALTHSVTSLDISLNIHL